MKLYPVSKVKLNLNNPRTIKDDKFQRLVASLQEFPEMASVRPIVCNTDMVILGGNMRFKAMQAAGWKEVPVEIVDWPESKQAEFVIKDNVSGGEWDWDALANEWDSEKINAWGIDIPVFNDLNETESPNDAPRTTDDDYSTYELIMLHENKLELLDVLNQIKRNLLFETQEECMMELIRIYHKSNERE